MSNIPASIILFASFLLWANPAGAADSPKTPVPSSVPVPSFRSFKEAYAAGNADLKNLRFEEAAADYGAAEELATTDKGKSQAANAAGWAFIREKKWQSAKSALDRAVKVDPGDKTALKNLGVSEFRLYEYGLSGPEELKSAVGHLEDSGENQELLERAKGAMSRMESYAQATPVAAPKLSGMSFKSLLAFGDQAQSQGRFDLAMKAFQLAGKAAGTPKAKAASANRQGMALLDAHRPLESVPYFEKAVEAQPKEKVYLNNLGFGYWSLYDSGKGKMEALKKAVDAFYRANSIDASYHSDNLKMALDELREMDPGSAKAYGSKDEPASEEPEAPSAKDEAVSESDVAK